MKKNAKYTCLLGIVMLLNFPTLIMAQGTVNSVLISPIKQPIQVIAPFEQPREGYYHQGIDVVAAMGTPIYAVADGMITKAAPDSKGVNAGGGHMIFIDHGDGSESRYMHLSQYAVAYGDMVKAGDLIGYSGDSGDTTGAHLHYEYRIHGELINPYFIFESLDTALSTAENNTIVEESFLVAQY